MQIIGAVGGKLPVPRSADWLLGDAGILGGADGWWPPGWAPRATQDGKALPGGAGSRLGVIWVGPPRPNVAIWVRFPAPMGWEAAGAT